MISRAHWNRQPRVGRGRPSSGFTLVELTVVIVLLMIMAAAVTPSLGGLLRGSELRTLLRRVSSQFAYARDYAISNGLLVRISCDSEQGAFELDVERDPAEQPGEFAPLLIHDLGRIALPEGVSISRLEVNGETPAQDAPYVYFFPDGQTDRAALALTYRDTEYTIELTPLTGRVQVKDASGEAYH